MSFGVTAVVSGVAGLVGAGASIWGAINSSNAAATANKQIQDNISNNILGDNGTLQQGYNANNLLLTQGQTNSDAMYDQAGKDQASYFQPYMAAGSKALDAQQGMLGLNGQGSQQAALDQLQNSSLFTGLQHQGEEAILRQQSATGGLRGGDTQSLLAQSAPGLLNNLWQQQFSQLGSLSSLGQNSASNLAGNMMGLTNGRAAANGNFLNGNLSNNQALYAGKTNAYNDQANANAAMTTAQANAFNQGLQGTVGSLSAGASGMMGGFGQAANFANQQAYYKLLSQMNGGGSK